MAKLWGGRFEGETDKLVEAFTESVSFDCRLAPYDVRGSIAHARMLAAQGILSREDAAAIVDGLEAILIELDAGRFVWDPTLEDVHTNIEAALTERIGEAGKRLHTARSRNDQIATDVRLWARDQADQVLAALCSLQHALLNLGEAHPEAALPGCTHLQHGQPVLFAHHMLAYFEMFDRDCGRFSDARRRINVLPLGSAALAGTPHAIDREAVARELGFDAVSENSMDAVSDRDFLIEFCAAASVCMMHLSRLCEDLILWSTPEFGFITIGDAFTTGSSIMPQKKNPDVAEIVRGKAGRVYGSLTALLTLMKGLPMTYNRDLQEDKIPAFDAADTLLSCLAVVARMLPDIQVNAARLQTALADGFLEATDAADYLAAKGVPFREAHAIVGNLVSYCEREGKTLPALSTAEFQRFAPQFGEDIHEVLSVGAMLERRDTFGGTAPRRVAEALRRARAKVSESS